MSARDHKRLADRALAAVRKRWGARWEQHFVPGVQQALLQAAVLEIAGAWGEAYAERVTAGDLLAACDEVLVRHSMRRRRPRRRSST